ncbi:MAG: response regulator transcription factor [Nocardioidaceae bacterium]
MVSRVENRARPGAAIGFGSVNRPDIDVVVPEVLARLVDAPEVRDCRTCQEHLLAIVEMIVAVVRAGAVSAKSESQCSAVLLTERERDVLRHLSGGMTAQQIARRLGISSSTVRKHLEHAYAKLGVHDRLTATIRMRELNLLPE